MQFLHKVPSRTSPKINKVETQNGVWLYLQTNISNESMSLNKQVCAAQTVCICHFSESGCGLDWWFTCLCLGLNYKPNWETFMERMEKDWTGRAVKRAKDSHYVILAANMFLLHSFGLFLRVYGVTHRLDITLIINHLCVKFLELPPSRKKKEKEMVGVSLLVGGTCLIMISSIFWNLFKIFHFCRYFHLQLANVNVNFNTE